jgi:hypothetical protein
MSVRDLDVSDKALLRRCLAFVVGTSRLGESFDTRVGVSRGEAHRILATWPEAGDDAEDSPAAVFINNALNEIVNGLTLSAADERTLKASRGTVQALYSRWAQSRGWRAADLR